jgi:RHS repeat-associated protein
MDSSGNLYGTAVGVQEGAVFEIPAGSKTVTTLVSFNGTNGEEPQSGLIMDSRGNLYGTTDFGGTFGTGNVFEIAAGSKTLTTLASFDEFNSNGLSANGADPRGGLVMDSSGNLYGTTDMYSRNPATVFELAAGSKTITTLASFDSNTQSVDWPGGLVIDSSDNLYGTTVSGGGGGTVFELAAGSKTITTLASFNDTTVVSRGGLVMDSSNNLYGTTEGGGSGGYGTVFEIAAGSKTITTLASFNGANGANPEGGLIMDSSNNLYGTTTGGNAFEVAAGSKTITSLASLFGIDGELPQGGLIMDSNGNLYGTAWEGGVSGDGTVFELFKADQWTGLGSTNSWSNPDNWAGDNVPAPNSALVFPSGAQQLKTNDDLGYTFSSITIKDTYSISGMPLTVQYDLTAQTTVCELRCTTTVNGTVIDASYPGLTVNQPLTLNNLEVIPGADLVIFGQAGSVHVLSGGIVDDFGTITVQSTGDSLTAGANNNPIDWASMQSSLQPPGISNAAWNAIYANLISQLGSTPDEVNQRLASDTSYLASLGETVTDNGQLFDFEIQQANGISPVQNLSAATDLTVQVPGLPLSIQRAFSSTIIGRNLLGPFGYGWALGGGWGQSLAVQPDGTVTISDSNGSQQTFQSEPANTYLAQPGDHNTLANLGNGVFTLTMPDGQITEFVRGHVAYIQDSDGNRITAAYAAGLLISLTDSAGQSINLAYNSAGRITTLTDSLGQTTRYTYDPTNQHLLSVTQYESPSEQVGYTTSYTYTTGTNPQSANALLSVTNPNASQQNFGYDAKGRLSQTSLNNGSQAIKYGYGTGGTVTATDADGGTTTYYFDNRGLIRKLVDPLGATTLYSYDATGNLTRMTNPAGQIYSYVHDSQGNLIQSTDPLGNITNFTYGPLATLTSATDPNANITRYQYDVNGDLVSTVFADGTIEKNAFNPIGELLQSTDGDGHVVNYSYNAAGQLLSKTYPGGSMTAYTYDSEGNLTSVSDSTGTTTLTYDSANRLIEVLYPDGMYLKYSYNSAGQRIRMVDQTGYTVNYSYNALGQLTGLTDASGNSIVAYTYDAAGRLSKQVKGNATFTQYTYDSAGHILSVINYAPAGAVNSSFVYTYNNLGLCMTETTSDGTWAYTYDATGQLTHAVFTPNSSDPDRLTGQDLQYVYDAAGNRTTTVINGVTTTYTVNDRNEYTQVGATSYTYDANGNMISQTNSTGTTAYTYNVNNQLTGIAGPNGGSSFQYDPFGNPYTVTQNGQVTQYLLDVKGGNVIGQFGDTGNVVAQYTYGLGVVSQLNSNNMPSYYDFDALGSTAGLTDASGSYVDSYGYLPFGASSAAKGTMSNPFQFVGEWGAITYGSGFDLMKRRVLDTSIGEFTSPDPLGLGQPTLYGYVNNNPIQAIDPTGLFAVTIGAGVHVGVGISVSLSIGSGGVALSYGAGVGLDLGVNISASSTVPQTGTSVQTSASVGPVGITVSDPISTTGDNPAPTGSLSVFVSLGAKVGISQDAVTTLSTNNGSSSNPMGDTTPTPQPSGLVNDGTVNVEPGGSLDNNGTLVNDGTINDDGALNNTGTETNNGTIDNNTDGNMGNDGNVYNDGNVTNSGTDTNDGGGNYDNNGNYDNSGNYDNNGSYENNGNYDNNGDGNLSDNGDYQDGGSTDDGDGITVAKGATLEVTGQLIEGVSGTLDVAGEVNVLPDGVVADLGALSIPATGSMNVVGEVSVEGGNYTPVGSVRIEQGGSIVMQTSTTTSDVTSTGKASVYGQTITFSVTVGAGASGAGIPTGGVTFRDQTGATLGTGTLNSSGVATFSTSALSTSMHTITANYGGDSTFGISNDSASATPLVQTVNEASTTTGNVVSSINPSVHGQKVIFSVTVGAVAPAAGVPTGAVTFSDQAGTLGTSSLNSTGLATFSISSLSTSLHTVTARYGGDPNFSASNDKASATPLVQRVNHAGTTTGNVASSANPSVHGQVVTFTATVTAVSPGAGTPTGTVTFTEGAMTLAATVAMTSGRATFTTSSLAVGAHTIAAVYSGDGNFSTSSGSDSVAPQVVGKDGVHVALYSSVSPSAVGQTITLIAWASALAPGSGVPTGIVTFNDLFNGKSMSLGTAAFGTFGVARLAVPALAAGNHTITASYAGDSNFKAQNSATYTEVVQQGALIASLVSSSAPSAFGQTITLTVTEKLSSGAAASGTVTFQDGTKVLTLATLNSAGQAKFSTGSLALGNHAIIAFYRRPGATAPSTELALIQSVAKATKTTLTASVNPVGLQKPVTFSATVTVQAPGTGQPAGSITFRDGQTVLGAGTINTSGVATFSTSTLQAGIHTITASYAGSGTFSASVSPAIQETVMSSGAAVPQAMAAALGSAGLTRSNPIRGINNVAGVGTQDTAASASAPTARDELFQSLGIASAEVPASTTTATAGTPSARDTSDFSATDLDALSESAIDALFRAPDGEFPKRYPRSGPTAPSISTSCITTAETPTIW